MRRGATWPSGARIALDRNHVCHGELHSIQMITVSARNRGGPVTNVPVGRFNHAGRVISLWGSLDHQLRPPTN